MFLSLFKRFVAVLLIFLSAVVLYAWHAGIRELLQLIPSGAPMQYNSALCFIALGLFSFLFNTRLSNRKLEFGLCIFVTTVSGLTLTQYLFGLNLGIDEFFFKQTYFPAGSTPGRMGPNTAFCFFLCGTSLLSLWWVPSVSRKTFHLSTSAGLTGGIALIGLFGYFGHLTEAYQWNGSTPMALHSGVGLILVSILLSITAVELGIRENERIPHWLPVSTLITGLTVSFILWQAVSANERAQIRDSVREKTLALRDRVTLGMQERKNSILRMARRWEFGGDGYLRVWKDDASSYQADFRSVRSLFLLNSKLTVLDFVESQPTCRAGNERVSPDLQKVLTDSVGSPRLIMVTSENSLTSQFRLLMAAPVQHHHSLKGFVIAEIAPAVLLGDLIPLSHAKAQVQVWDHARLVFSTIPSGTLASADWEIDVPLELSEVTKWRLTLRPLQGQITGAQSRTHWVGLGLGFFLSLVLSGFVYLWRKTELSTIAAQHLSEEMKENKTKLSLALNSSLSAAWAFNLETEEVAWDDNSYPIYGFSGRHFPRTFRDCISLIHPDDRSKVEKAVTSSIAENKDLTLEYRTVWPDSSEHMIFAQGRISKRNKNGKPTEMTGLCWDVTERRKTELENLMYERRFSTVLESAPDSLIITDITGTITYINHQTVELFGYKKAELIGQKIEILVPDGLRTQHIVQRDQYVQHAHVRPMGAAGRDLMGRRKDGSLLSVEISLSPSNSPQDFFVVASIRDITKRKQIELQIRTLAAVVESSNDFIGICSPDLKPIFLNEAGRRMVGLDSVEDVQKTTVMDYFVPEDRGYIESVAVPILKAEGRWSGEVRFRHFKTNEHIHTIWNAFLIKDAEGNATAWATVSPNLNRLKESEEQTKKSLHEKEILLREIHHRVKNNLNIISSLLDLQAHTFKNPAIVEAFRESQNRVMSMALIHEKLYQSKSIAEIDFSDYVTELVDTLFYSYGIDRNRFGVEVDIQGISFEIDTAIPCSLIINELVSNALKHAFKQKTHGKVVIRIHPNSNHTPYRYLLMVADDGVGIPKDFDVEKSSSLGLKIVRTLTRQLGGILTISKGTGTIFTIQFGLTPEKERKDAA